VAPIGQKEMLLCLLLLLIVVVCDQDLNNGDAVICSIIASTSVEIKIFRVVQTVRRFYFKALYTSMYM
jgi:hypothetical protein